MAPGRKGVGEKAPLYSKGGQTCRCRHHTSRGGKKGSTKPPGAPRKVPHSHPNPAWCRPCSPSRWLRERYLSPSSSRITGREIFITTTHCGQLRGVTWKMSCRVERIAHVSRKAGGIFCCFKDHVVVWQRLREGHPRYKKGRFNSPNRRISSRSVMIQGGSWPR